MKYYIDTEFDGHNGPLLSLAMVREDGASIHVSTFEKAVDPWVVANVVPFMEHHLAHVTRRVPILMVGGEIHKHIGADPDPVIVADSAVDISRFCQALTTDEHGHWASFDGSIKFEVHDVNCYPTDLVGAVQHNAWWDAMALRRALTLPDTDTRDGAE